MTPVERLQAAIHKLGMFVVPSIDPIWTAGKDDGDWDGVGSASTIRDSEGDHIGQMNTHWDADCIVTLHRTIDAQLLILQTALAGATVYQGKVGMHHAYIQDALKLADAILNTPALAEDGDS